jgi:hypothetical protein
VFDDLIVREAKYFDDRGTAIVRLASHECMRHHQIAFRHEPCEGKAHFREKPKNLVEKRSQSCPSVFQFRAVLNIVVGEDVRQNGHIPFIIDFRVKGRDERFIALRGRVQNRIGHDSSPLSLTNLGEA